MRAARFATVAVALACGAACSAGPQDQDEIGEEWATATSPTLVLRGTVITMDEARGTAQVLEGGAVVVKADKIQSVLAAGAALPSGKNVVVLPSATGPSDWVITPGLINLHNHLAYNTADIYRELPLYENTYQWRDEKYYDFHIQNPKRAFSSSTATSAELHSATPGDVDFAGLVGRYGEVKELVSGTTSTQGSYFGSSVPAGYGQHLVRNVDWTNFGQKRVSQASLGVLVGTFDPRTVIARMDAGEIDAWLVHLLEGTDQVSRDEFDCLKAMGLVRKELVIIHGTALTPAQLGEMAKAGSKLVVSPLDNLLYYGQTADIATAHKLGMNVSLGTDWSPAGSKNLLSELKVLDLLNKQVYGNALTDRDMVQMVTTNPSDAIGWTGKVGRIKQGLAADLAVYTKKPGTPYRSVLDATEKDVRLVVVGGDPLYGDAAVMKKLKPKDHEAVPGCTANKAIDITTTNKAVDHGDVTLAVLTAALDEGLRFDGEWFLTHYAPAKAGGWTSANVASKLKSEFPNGILPRTLNPIYTCDDRDYLDEVRTDANVRTAFGGICLDLRPWFLGGAADCGPMPKKPALVTIAQHPGTVPQRPAAWCAAQSWGGTGPLPVPPKN